VKLVTDVAVLIPTLGRGYHIKPLLDSLYKSTDRARPVFILRKGDSAEASIKEYSKGLDIISLPASKTGRGDYAKKINAGCWSTNEPLIFMAATDLKFHEGWLEAAERRLDNGIHCVGTNDLGNLAVMKGEHSTHSLMTREYVQTYGTIDEPGKALHEGYWHEFVDNEFVETAQYRNAWAMALDSHVEHMHPAFGKGGWDDSYAGFRDRVQFGMDLFAERKHLWT
jgi:hypothetical protein